MPIRRVNSGWPRPRALEFAPIVSGFTFEVSVEHGHRTETEIFNSFQSLSSFVKSIAGITDKGVTTKNIPVAITSFLKKFSGIFERRQIIRSIVSEENLLGFNFPE